MKLRFLTLLTAGVVVMAGLAACTEEMEEMVERTIVAVVEEGSVTTRTCVSDEDGETVGILWAPGNAIGVYSASGSENAMFTTEITEPTGEAAFAGQMTNTPKYGKLCAGLVWDFDFETFPTLRQPWVEVSDRSYTSPVIATPSLLEDRKISSDGYSSPTNGSDSPFMWWPLFLKDDTFTQTAADRWDSIKGDILTYAEEVRYMQTYLAESWKYNHEMWPLNRNQNCDRDWVTSSGFCGDETMTSFDEVYNAFYSAYTKRVSGMNTFVSQKDWSASKWDNYISY